MSGLPRPGSLQEVAFLTVHRKLTLIDQLRTYLQSFGVGLAPTVKNELVSALFRLLDPGEREEATKKLIDPVAFLDKIAERGPLHVSKLATGATTISSSEPLAGKRGVFKL